MSVDEKVLTSPSNAIDIVRELKIRPEMDINDLMIQVGTRVHHVGTSEAHIATLCCSIVHKCKTQASWRAIKASSSNGIVAQAKKSHLAKKKLVRTVGEGTSVQGCHQHDITGTKQ